VRICLVGGIYGKGGVRKEFIQITPETTLETGFRAAGHQVTTLSHYDGGDFDRFDVVHVHHLSYGALRLASDDSRTPFVFTAHETCRMCGLPQPLAQRAAMRYVLSRADGIVALTQCEAGFQRSAYRLNGAVHATIPNGLDAERYPFRRNNSAGDGRPWQLLYVGQLIPLKGVDLILRALASLPLKIELTLAYQNDQLEDELKRLASSLGIADRVQFRGKQRPAELAMLYQASDLLILPSASEALPSVLIEAMLSGLPFIATTVGGIPELANGFSLLLEERTPATVAQGIGYMLDNYERFAATGGAMSNYARERFAISKMIDLHVALYQRVAAIGRPRRHSTRFGVLNGVVRHSLQLRGAASMPREAIART
jgi:glycosyltransferase involved in cell wall biosynthesis